MKSSWKRPSTKAIRQSPSAKKGGGFLTGARHDEIRPHEEDETRLAIAERGEGGIGAGQGSCHGCEVRRDLQRAQQGLHELEDADREHHGRKHAGHRGGDHCSLHETPPGPQACQRGEEHERHAEQQGPVTEMHAGDRQADDKAQRHEGEEDGEGP